ncbi:DUF732 domain-containing protein [Mycobacterium colombiense]|uniref:DUF732 domain-containing protein n=1 Tax=Mycobacterium colombiense TaxID=339268 RepID=A0A853LYR3_9MYCO|nr:DUF732 domain-containing protein [Mycobacterium colombiense]OBJ21783.1 hypothetical protein A5623_09890 [Mycobacterium colombiense]OBJ60712.1 hypothetical protein A5628_08395 [Mycobacterium colombiense]
MRDREKIDSELRLIALRRQAIREQGGRPSSLEADALLDEILAHGAGSSEPGAFEDWEAEILAADPSRDGKAGAIASRRRKVAALRRLGLFAALPLSLVAVVSAVVVMFALHRQDPSAEPQDSPPSAAPSAPVAPKASAPAVNVADSTFVAALKQEGVPVPSQEYVTNQGHAVCEFLAHQPNFADAVGFVQRNSIWDANQSAKVTAGAIVSYCPQSRPTGPDPMQPDYQKSLTDLQDIERHLQDIQGKLHDIQGGLDAIPGHP